ncbi:MAG: FAD-dependent oxidoreductase [Proteobacteria bacterium]|nr:FAD-dependent oxidoreductase [Pseudomonadota bacterium]
MGETVAIAGAGHAAGQVVATLRQKKFDGTILLIGEEPWLPYQRPPLSKKFLAGELPAERLHFKPESFYDDPGIAVRLGTRIDAVDRSSKTLHTADGKTLAFDKLVFATGARPRLLDLPGVDLDGIHYLRTIADVTSIRKQLKKGARLTIVGAGYIGLEVAAVATQLGAIVTVIEMEDRVMSRVVSPQLSEFYQNEHSSHGVKLLLATGISGFSGDGQVAAVDLSNDGQVATDLVVIGIGVVPNTELASDAGLDVDNGIVVDNHCQTSASDIFAVGDCTHHPNDILGYRVRLESVHNALEQAKTAASNICGVDTCYAQVPWFWSDQYDLKLQIAGLSRGYDQVIVRGNPDSRSFSCLYLRDGQLIAVDAVNSPKDFMQSKKLIAAHSVIDPEMLANPEIELKTMVA